MTLHPRRRNLRFKLATIAWLTVVWVLFWGDLTVANVLAGLVLATLVSALLPMPTVEFHGRVRPLGLLRLVGRFAADLVVASAQVAVRALDPRRLPKGAVIAVQLRNHSDLYLTLTSELVCLVPGSVVVEAHRVTGVLYVHVLDVDISGGIEGARKSVLDQEERVLRALASDAELEEAGLAPRRSVREEVAA